MGLHKLKDEALLDELDRRIRDQPWVFVTADDRLPHEHGEYVATRNVTVATIDGEWEEVNSRHGGAFTQSTFRMESVHRWAHSIADQDDGTIARYSPFAKRPWKQRRQHR